MRKLSVFVVIILLLAALILTACIPESIDPTDSKEPTNFIPPTDVPTPTRQEISPANLGISSLTLEWPEIHPPETCMVELLPPMMKLCLRNSGGESAAAEFALLAIPPALAPGSAAAVMENLPMGNWGMPEPVVIEGFPGVDGSAQGIVIQNMPPPDDGIPPPDDSTVGIIFFTNLPAVDGSSTYGIVIQNIPGPDGGFEGIMIAYNAVGVKEISHVMGIIMEDSPVSSIPPGIKILNSNPVQQDALESEPVSIEGVPGFDGSAEGIVIQNLPVADGSLQGIVIQNIPAADSGVFGIVIQNMPADDSSVPDLVKPLLDESIEGILILNNVNGGNNTSHVMGIIMEDKPGEEGSQVMGPIIIDKPGDDGIKQVMGIVVIDQPGDDGSSQGIVIQNIPQPDDNLVGAVWTGMPIGFDMGDMMPMMGEGDYSPGVILLARVFLEPLGLPAEIGPNAESCIQIGFDDLPGALPAEEPPPMTPDSFFDVYTELTVGVVMADDSAALLKEIVQIPSLPGPICTEIPELLPTEAPTWAASASPTRAPVLHTSTPTKKPAAQPTDTPYVRPTDTPYVRPTNTLPPRITDTPGRSP